MFHGSGDFFAALAVGLEQRLHFAAQFVIAAAGFVEEGLLLRPGKVRGS
jgi:hypothetical protein